MMRILTKLCLCFGILCWQAIASAEIIVDYGTTVGIQGVSKDSGKLTTPGASSVDLLLDMDLGAGFLHVFIEGATSAAGTVDDVVGGANADIGTAADQNGDGRLQLSELSYALSYPGYSIIVGMQGLAAFVDANSTSNSETDQFMAGSLVNNPTVAMPDYTISAVLNYGYANRSNITLMVANAYGLADNDSADYADLFDFGTTDAGLEKGIFALGELRMEDQDVWLSLGYWVNTREDDGLLGGYINLDSAADEEFAWSTRFGWSDTTTGIGSFMSLSTAFAYDDDALGVGVAWHQLVAEVGNVADPILTEAYYRWQITDMFSITPDLQWWSNANALVDNAGGVTGGTVLVYGLRLQYGASVEY